MRIILDKAERESAKSMKDAIASVLDKSTQNIVDDYSKGISMFSDQKGNTIIDIKTDFVTDLDEKWMTPSISKEEEGEIDG